MKSLLMIPMILMLVACAGCNRAKPITKLEVGREKLLGAGRTIEAIGDLTEAETKEAKTPQQKVEPRALLLIAYTNALSTGDAQIQGLVEPFENERQRRLVAMGEAEMRHIIRVLNEQHRIQKDAMQVLIDKGSDVVPVLIESLRRYPKIQKELIEMLSQIGSKDPRGLNQMIAALKLPNTNTSPSVKVTLVQLIGLINDKRAIPDLESVRDSGDMGLRMEIDIALYKLGETEHRANIIDGLKDSNVAVRRAASKALSEINDSPVGEIITILKDSDAQVRAYAAQALIKFPTKKAINPLIDILKKDSDERVKEVAKKALIVHAQKRLGKKLAARLINELESGQIAESNDRLRIVQILKTDELKRQIKNAPLDDQLEYNLYKYFEEKEQNDMVKEELNRLLLELESM